MGRDAVSRLALVLCLAIVSLAVLLGLLGAAQEQVYAASPWPASRGAALHLAPPEDSTGAPAASPPMAPLANGVSSVITVCSTCPYTTVQAAVSAVAEYGTVKVAQGVYTDTDGNGEVVAITKTITLRGGYTTTNWSTSDPIACPTVLDGEGGAQVLYVASGTAPVIEGLHIRNGWATNGGGVYIAGGGPTLRRNRIYNNAVTGYGGGIYIAGGEPRLENNLVYSATSQRGGGVYVAGGTPLLHHNTLYDNQASKYGGGIYVGSGEPVISATIVVSNVAPSGDGGGIYSSGSSTITLGYNDVWGNSGGNYSGVTTGTTDISTDPLFVDPVGADFRLQAGSTCVDYVPLTQTVAVDYRGWARPVGERADVGAYELYPGNCFAKIEGATRVYTTVQAAVDVAGADDLVKVAGYCTGSGSEVVNLNTALTLRGGYTVTNWSTADPDTYPTILDGEGARRVVYIGSVAATVEGFHAGNGSVSGSGGGGVYVSSGGNVTLRDNAIYSNSVSSASADGGGGGVYVAGGTVVIQDNVIHDNRVSGVQQRVGGGGVYIADGSVTVRNNEIYSNTANCNDVTSNYSGGGGGIYVAGGTAVEIQGNDIFSNTMSGISQAKGGGGVYVYDGDNVVIQYNTIFANTVNDTAISTGGGGVYIWGGSTHLEDNEIRDNKASSYGGGGIYINTGSSTVRGNAIYSNTQQSGSNGGGGIYLYNSSSTIEGNDIYANSASASYDPGGGGGIYIENGSPAIRNNLVRSNTTDGNDEGGGIFFYSASPTVDGNTIYDNWASGGGGIYRNGGGGAIRNNIVVSNTNWGIYGSVTVYYSDIWGNTTGQCGGGASCAAGDGNIAQNPDFVNPSVDFHPQAGSSCIDAGNPSSYPASDYDGYVRPFGPAPDMGAYEFYTGTCFAQIEGSARVYSTTQAAVDAASAGDLVKVAGYCAGVETRGGLSQTVYIDKGLTLRGGYTLTNWTTPTTYAALDAQGLGRAIYITSTGTISVEGFILRGGSAVTGGGLYIAAPLSPTIQNVVFYNNTAQYGGGLAAAGGSSRLYNNTFVTNTATAGGGLYFAAGAPTISNTIIVSNSGGSISTTVPITLCYSDVWGNEGCDWCAGVAMGTGSFSAAPLFMGFDAVNFHLQTDSPCIHTADPATALDRDFEGDPRPLPAGGRSDIGADESTTYRSVTFEPYRQSGGIPGQSIVHLHYLTNTGSVSGSFHLTHTLDVSGTVSGWDVDYTSIFTLATGVQVEVPVTVTVPGDAAVGSTANVVITATSGAVYDVVSNTTVVSLYRGVDFTPFYVENANPGTAFAYVHTLTNTGNVPDTFLIDLVATTYGWSEVTPTQVSNLEPNQAVPVWITVTVPYTAPGGLVETTVVTATSQNDSQVQAAVTDTTQVNHTPGTRYVSTSGSDELNNCLEHTTPCRTVGYGVVQAASGDTIKVAAGTYAETEIYVNKDVTLQGGYTTGDWDTPDPTTNLTVLDGGGGGRVMRIAGSPTVEGFWIQNGNTDGGGGGMYIIVGGPLLRGNVITNCAAAQGGGVYNYSVGDVRLSGNEFYNNTASAGGGFYNALGDPHLTQNVFEHNQASGRGGAVYVASGNPTLERNRLAFNVAERGGGFAGGSGNPSFWNNLVYENTASVDGGGVYVTGGNPRVWHNTVYTNTAAQGGGLYLAGGSPLISNTIIVSNTAAVAGGGVYSATGGASLNYNDVWGNAGGDYVGLSTVYTSDDPLFVGAAGYDLRLQTTSPLVDQGGDGSVDEDYWGEPRPMGSAPDIGADEVRVAGVSLAPDNSGSDVPGQTVVYTHTLTNEGNYTDTFDLTWQNGDGWDVEVNEAASQPVTVTLGAGVARTITVAVTIPSSGVMSGTVNTTVVTATSEANSSVQAAVWDTTTVEQGVVVSLWPDYLVANDTAGRANGGQAAVYTHTLKNDGNYTDTFTLEAHSSGGLTVTLSADSILLPMGVTETVYVTVTVPVTTGFWVDTAVVTATSVADPAEAATATDQTFVNRTAAVELEPDWTDSGADTTIHYYHTLTNTGDYTDTFDLTLFTTQGWGLLVTSSPVEDVGPLMTTTVHVRVTIPPTATGGMEDVTIVTATSRFDSNGWDMATDTTTVICDMSVSISPTAQTQKVNSNPAEPTPVVYAHTLKNEGNCTGVFTITATSDQGWATAVEAQTVQLAPWDSTTVHITVTVPATDTGYANLLVDHTTVKAMYQTDPAVFDTGVDTTVVNQVAGVGLTEGAGASGAPEDLVYYAHTLTNSGNYTDTFDLLLGGWGGFDAADGPVTKSVQLGAGMTDTVTIVVSVPDEPCGTQGLSAITATSRFSPTVSATAVNTTTVLHGPALDIQGDQVSYAASNGSQPVMVTYSHVVTNTSNCVDTFEITATNSAAWAVTVFPSSISDLASGAAETVHVTVTVPMTTPACWNLLEATTLVTATSQTSPNPQASNSDATVINRCVSAALAPDNSSVVTQVTDASVQAIYTHTLTNTGNYTDSFSLARQSSRGWGTGGTNTVSDLGPGMTATVQVRVTVPQNVYTATDATVVTATSAFQQVSGLLSFAPTATAVNTTLVRRPHVTLSPGQESTADPGALVAYTHVLTNTGGLTDTYDITATGWVAGITPTVVYTVEPGSTALVTVTVQVPTDALSNTVNSTTITATSRITEAAFAAVADSTIVRYAPGAEWSSVTPRSADPGELFVYTHTLTNTGNYTETFDLSLNYGKLVYAQVSPSEVGPLGPGQAVSNVQVSMYVLPSAAGGEQDQTSVIAEFQSVDDQVVVVDLTSINYISGTRYVAPDGQDEDSNCRFASDPCATVQHAVDQAIDGDTAKIATGVYTGVQEIGGTVQVVRVSEALTLTGGYDTSDWDTADPVARPTVLDAQEQGRVIYVAGSVVPVIDGFHLRRGHVDGDGAGLYIAAGAAPTVRRNFIYSNTTVGDGSSGGGVYYGGGGNPVLERNTVYSNTAEEDGGGFYIAGGSPRVWNNVIYHNVAGDWGGGLYLAGSGPTVLNNTFYSNTASTGGGLYLASGSPVLSNTIVVHNSAVITGGGVYNLAAGAALAYNDVWHNAPNDYSGASAGTGSISAAPRFVDGAGGDLHLRGDSPAINAGDPNAARPDDDRDGNSRPLLGMRHDIGAYEYSLVIYKTVAVTAAPGATITYTIGLSNTGEATASNIPVTDTLHPYLYDLALHTAGSEYVTGTRTISWTGDVPGSSVVYITFTARITTWLAAGTPITNVAWVDHVRTDVVTTTVSGKPGPRYVATTGSDAGEGAGNNCLLPDRPCRTVQYAADQALAGDTVMVAVGVYTGTGQVVSVSKGITLTGGYTTTTWSDPDPGIYTTTLDAQGGAGVVITGPAAMRVAVAGFHVVGGSDGVAVYTATAIISRCHIYGNGDGVRVVDGGLTLERTWVYSNTGDGVQVEGGAYALDNNVIAHNAGAGLQTASSSGALRHNTFARNGVAGAVISSTARFTNTIFYSHTTAISVAAGSTAYLSHTLWYSYTNLSAGPGTLISSTGVYSAPAFYDPDALDYHIRVGSGAINAGLDTGLNEDIDGDPRPLLGFADLGADEFALAISKWVTPSAAPGEVITYVITLEGEESGLVLTDTLHSHLSYTGTVACTVGSCGYLAATRAITWTGSISTAQPAYITYTAQITTWLAAGEEVVNDAWVQTGGEVLHVPEVRTTILPITGTRYVAPAGEDAQNNCRMDWKPCATVQQAVDQALAGDTVKVAQGTYTGSGANVVSITESLTLQGGYTTTNWLESDPVARPTILDGEGSRRVVHITGPVTVTLDGFRLINGFVNNGDGSGLYVYTATVTLANGRVYGNRTDGVGNDGGGIYQEGGSLTITATQVYSNTSDDGDGGGLYYRDGEFALVGSRVYSNTAGSGGGGLYLRSADVTLSGNYIYTNTATGLGGGLYVTGPTALDLTNNVIAANQAGSGGGGLYCDGGGSGYLRHTTIAENGVEGLRVGDFTLALTNTILVSHTVGITTSAAGASVTANYTLWDGTGVYTDTAGGGAITTANDLTGAPKFLAPEALDYHIRGDSAALDAGTWDGVAEDIDGDTRTAALVDVGADQYPLRLARWVSTSSAAPCEVVTHTLRLSNLRATPLAGVVLGDLLDDDVSWAGFVTTTTGSAVYSSSLHTVGWLGTVPAEGGEAVYITYTARITPYLTSGTLLTHVAGISDPISIFGTQPITVSVATLEATLGKSAVLTASLGQVVTYTVAFTVPAGHVAHEPTVVDALPRLVTGGGISTTPALTYVVGSGSPPPTALSADGTLTWTLSTVTATCDAAEVVTVTFAARVRGLADNGDGDLLTNTVTLSYTESSPTGPAHVLVRSHTATLVEPQPAIVKTLPFTTNLGSGDLVTVTIVVSNTGTGVLYDLVVTDTLPAALDFRSATPTYVRNGAAITWTLGSLGVDQQRLYTITARVTETVGAGVPLTNTARVEGTSQPGVVDEERAYSDGALATATTGYPDLLVSKSGPPVRSPLQTIAYTVAYTNVGVVRAEGVWITDTLPISLTGVVSATSAGAAVEHVGQVVTWTLTAPVSRGVSGRIWITATVSPTVREGDVLTNVVSVEVVTTTEQVLGNNSGLVTTTIQMPSLVITKTAHPSPVRPGSLLTYTLTISNTGLGDATGLVVSDTVPPNTAYRWCSGGDTCAHNGDVVTWTLASLEAAQQAQVSLTVLVDDDTISGTTVLNQAYSVTCAQGVMATGAPLSTTVALVRGVSLEPATLGASVSPGESAVYTHTLTNLGNAVATFDLAVSSPPPGWTFSLDPPGAIVDLAPDSTAFVALTVQAPSGGTGQAVALITATWHGAPSVFATAQDTTTIGYAYIYLPLALRNYR
ncbi:MAG: right-handed parallel beta-helix repeat-containing protein [Anaerolineae bacterium]